MNKKVLILSDFVGYGNVALATTRAILTGLGCETFCLPTAVISNTWNWGSTAQLDTTAYLAQAEEVWQTLGFRFDAVFIGYIASREQAAWIASCCRRWRENGAVILMDPIFADQGKLYNGISPEQIAVIREILPLVDFLLPNTTEARFLTGTTLSDPEALARLLPCRNVLITGTTRNHSRGVLLRSGGHLDWLPYTPIPGEYSGTGDVFSAQFLGALLDGKDSKTAAEYAMAKTAQWIQLRIEEQWPSVGIPAERYLQK